MSQKFNEEKQDQRNMLWALFLITTVLFGMNILYPAEKNNTTPIVTGQVAEQQPVDTVNAPVIPTVEVVSAAPVEPVNQTAVLENDYVSGVYNVTHGGIESLKLLKYKETTAEDSPAVVLLSDMYQTRSGWTSPDTKIPLLTAIDDKQAIQNGKPLEMTADNGVLRVVRKVDLDNAYLLSTTDRITNLTDKPIRVSFNSEIVRVLPQTPETSVVHEGFVAVLKDKLIEEKYADIKDDSFDDKTKGGWYGLTDKYWQSAFILSEKEKGTVLFEKIDKDIYAARFIGNEITIPAGETYEHISRTFTGAKDVNILADYEAKYNIPKFYLSIDFGWFQFLTRPFLYALNWLYGLLGNMGIAIIILATLIRLLLLPIATKSYESMARMRKVQPKMQQLKTRFKDDPQRLQIEMMNLYKRENVNPMSGCLPMFLQIPVFYALYKVLSVAINMRQAPFFGWIDDLSMRDPASLFTAFGLIDWTVPTWISWLDIGIWPILMGITMYLQQKMSPAPTDEVQAKVLKWLPIVFTFMLGGFAAGLVIYWTWSNVLSIAQQRYIIYKVGKK